MVKKHALAEDWQVTDDDAPESSFQSPSCAGQTDYELEYTHSNNEASAGKSRTDASATRSESSSLGKGTKGKSKNPNIIQPGAKQQRKKPPKNLENPAANAAEPKMLQKRKQLKPMHRERNLVKEIMRLQASTEFLIPRLPFSRLVREIMFACSPDDPYKITHEALAALQCTSEMYITQRMEDAYLLTLHRGRVTLTARDLELINFLRNKS